ncbi:MAG: HlyC/CorC family transporter [Anaerolineales bacterium]|nr:HlyC/CorC family transporter [Anaerolineae bacterium]PWB55755.1 MAG: HlyC/CorC family transporter [Anaerolineales bacterium]
MLAWDFLLIMALVALNAFFTSIEFASVAARKARIELAAEEGNKAAEIVKGWLDNPVSRSRLIAACQLGITIVSLTLGAVGENTFEQLLTPLFRQVSMPPSLERLSPLMAALPLIFSLIIITSIHVVLGEQVPKVATLHQPERVALLGAQPMRIFSLVFKWFIDLLDWVTRLILRLFGLELVGGHSLIYTVDELKQMITESEEGGVLEPPEREMLESVFDFGELLVRQVMVPRTEIVAIEASTRLDDIIAIVTQHSYTKLPVYEADLDQIAGILHVKDVLRVMKQSDCEEITAGELARETLYIPETLPVNDLLRQFRHNRQHIAIVLDEFGGTAGLVTLEDLLEEIVGEVSDQFDKATPEIQTQPDGSVLIDGLTLMEAVNQQLELNLSDPHYDTIAGYFLGKLGHIPKVGDAVDSGGVQLKVEAMDGLRIARLSLVRLKDNPPE